MTDTPHIPPEVEAKLGRTTVTDRITHCIGELVGIVKYTYLFENHPSKKARQLERNKQAVEKAIAILEGLVAEHSAERERLILKKDIKYLTLKARYQRMFLGGEEDALVTKRRKKQLIKRLAQLSTANKEKEL